MPNVHLASPGSKPVCPNSDACWSPMIAVSGIPATGSTVLPNAPIVDRISGSITRGTRMAASSRSSQSRVSRFISMVRLALVTSVTCRPPLDPPVRFQTSQVSMVPNSRSPRRRAIAQ